jgi:branched-chain amino acid transport system substrate-binding protein
VDAIRRAGESDELRAAVIEQPLQDQGARESVLGTYDIDENGDTTITDYGAYRIRGGGLRFNRTIKARAPLP